MTAAVTRATFSDFRLIKGRKVAQFVFEVAAEQADDALEALGGLPRADIDRWCAIARLSESGLALSPGGQVDRAATPQPVNGADVPPSPNKIVEGLKQAVEYAKGDTSKGRVTTIRPRTPFHSKPLSQQAGILCNDVAFREWLGRHLQTNVPISSKLDCKVLLSERVDIRSFSQLDNGSIYTAECERFIGLVEEFERDPKVGRAPRSE